MKIDKGVPIPESSRHGKLKDGVKYLIDSMQPGDSVFIEGSSSTRDTKVERVRKIIYRNGWTQAAKREGNGVRVWRVDQ